MAKTPETVFAFLADLEAQLRPLGEAEKVKLLALKKEECEKRGIAYDDELYLWDYRSVPSSSPLAPHAADTCQQLLRPPLAREEPRAGRREG